MQASFDNIKSFIEDRFAQESQLEPNHSFSESSPVPVDLGPRQAQTDPSVCNPCIAFGAGGQAQEPVREVSATSSFLASLWATGIAVPQGIVIGDRVDRDVSSATVHGVPVVAAQHEQPQEPLRGGRPPQAAAAHLPLCVRSRMRSRILFCALVGSRRLMVSFLDLLWGNHLMKLPFVR